MVVKIGVMGCCVSDDIFRSPHNYKYWEDFEKTFILARTTLISLAQKPINVNRDELIISKETEYTEHNINCMYNDMIKRFYQVMSKDIQYLMLDLFFDAYFGVLLFEDNIITNNHWHLPYTNFYKKLSETKTITPTDNLDEYMELFKKYSQVFFNNMKEKYPDTKIFLISVRMMEYRTLGDGSEESFVNMENPVNKALKILEDYVCENYDVFFIDFEETSLDKNHIWGPGKVHFAKEFYQYDYRKILNIVKYDEINNKINQLDVNNDKITEELVHELSSIKNANRDTSAQKHYTSIIDKLRKDINELKIKNDSLHSKNKLIEQELKRKESTLNELRNDKKNISLEYSKIETENMELKQINDSIINSTSWNITKPLRLISNKIKKLLDK